jgi:hypothetical protein
MMRENAATPDGRELGAQLARLCDVEAGRTGHDGRRGFDRRSLRRKHWAVIRSGMLGNRGLWVVRGPTFDGQVIDLTVAVVSTEYDVELLEVCSVKKAKGARK